MFIAKKWVSALLVLVIMLGAAAATAQDSRVTVAKHFSIEDLGGGAKRVVDGAGRTFCLVPKGAPVPAQAEGTTLIETPVTNVMFTSTTQVGMMQPIADEAFYDSIGAVTTAAAEWTIPEMTSRVESGKIAYFESTNEQTANAELVQQLNPSVVFVGAGDPAATALCAQMEELGIPYVVDGCAYEQSETAYLEWVKLFAAFYAMDDQADAFFTESVQRVRALEAMTEAVENKPVVAMALLFGGTVYTFGGESSSAELINHAGGVYAFKDVPGTGSVTISMEEFVDKAMNADILIYTSLPQYMSGMEGLLAEEPLLKEFKAVREDNVWIYTLDYYMASAALADKFQDVVHIVHPELIPDWTLKHYQKLT